VAWFGVRLLFEAIHSEEKPDARDLFEDRILLVEAEDSSEARAKAERLGFGDQPEYRNQYGDVVSWRLVEVLDVCALREEPSGKGTEVFWSFLSREEVDQLRKWQEPFEDRE